MQKDKHVRMTTMTEDPSIYFQEMLAIANNLSINEWIVCIRISTMNQIDLCETVGIKKNFFKNAKSSSFPGGLRQEGKIAHA